MSLVARIRGFLLVHPKPVTVRVTVDDGDPEVLKPGKSYAKLAETIEALGATLVECLDAQGNILRAMKVDEDVATRSEAAPVPDGLKADPHALMLTHFANLLHRAYEHSTEIAFGKMVELVDKMNDRADGIEARLERAEAQNRRMLLDQTDAEIERAEERAEQAAAAGGEGALGDQLVQSFLAGQLQRNTGANGHAGNGAPKAKG